jgi:DNA-binding phage protein
MASKKKSSDGEVVAEFLVTVRKRMEATGMSMTELSRRTGLARAHVYRLLSGANTPSLRNAEAIASAVGMRLVLRKSR